MPLKTFYRLALPHVPPAPSTTSADGGGGGAAAEPLRPAAASFEGLPPSKVLTLGMDEPEPW